jgi:uncharacterized membrane protein
VPESRRLSAFDTLRGFIMAVMAIDHVSGSHCAVPGPKG